MDYHSGFLSIQSTNYFDLAKLQGDTGLVFLMLLLLFLSFVIAGSEVGGVVVGTHAYQRQRQAHCGHHDPHRERFGHGLGHLGSGGSAHHRARCDRDLVCAQLHRQRLCHGKGFDMFDWMVRTTPVVVFFSCIGLMLVGMTVWEIKSPTVMRKGFLPMATTRGDRLFIGLLGAAYINLAFVGVAGWLTERLSLDAEPSVWISLGLSIVWLLGVMRKG